MSMCRSGLRVDVFSGNQKEYLGQGAMVGFVPVYIIRNEDGSISSPTVAEQVPDGIPEEMFTKIESNPKIKLDSGRIVYGCQVWWNPVKKDIR